MNAQELIAGINAVIETANKEAEFEATKKKYMGRLNAELDELNKVTIPAKKEEIESLTSALGQLDNTIDSMNGKVSSDTITAMRKMRKDSVAALSSLREELYSLTHKASVLAKEKTNLNTTKYSEESIAILTPKPVTKKASASTFGTLALAVKN